MVTRLQLKDLPEIEKIAQTSAGPGFSWSASALRESMEKDVYWGISDSQGLLGFVLTRDLGEVLEILAIVTRTDGRRQGVAENLLRQVLSDFPKKEIWLEVHESNLGARNLYEKLGFCQVGVRPRYYSDGASAYLLSLKVESGRG